MIEIEKAILATCMSYPKLLPILFENCDELEFDFLPHQVIYSELKRLYEEGQTIDQVILYSVLKNKVPDGYVSIVMETTQTLYSGMAESWLIDKISVIKRHKAKIAGLKQCVEEFESTFPDFDKIIEIAESGKVIELNKEPYDFESAYLQYTEWKNKEKTNIITGFPSIDRQIDGLNYGELFGIMGRTTTGKTFSSINMLNSIITKTTEKIGFFSLEMSKATFIERMMQIHFSKSRWDIWRGVRDGTLYVDGFSEKYRDLNIYERVYSVADMSRIVESHRLKIVFIDFLQLIRKTRGKSIYENVSYQIEELKALAKNKECVIFLLVQLSRKGEGGWVPVTIDMARDSGTIEENCDFLMGIWNPNLCENLSDDDKAYWNGKISVKLLKNKRGTTVGIECNFDTSTGKMIEVSNK